jgi:hypothetical protein
VAIVEDKEESISFLKGRNKKLLLSVNFIHIDIVVPPKFPKRWPHSLQDRYPRRGSGRAPWPTAFYRYGATLASLG